MMKAVLKTLAISFGGGLALGAGIRLTQGPAKSRREPGVDLDPVLSRLKNVESRIVQMETTPVRAAAPAPATSPVVEKTLASFESRLAAQFTDVQQLRSEIRHVDQRLLELDAQLPVIIQSTVDVRFQETERKLREDFEEAQNRTMAAFVSTLQTKVVERISTLESNLAEQSSAIGKLRDTSLRTDENLQKMVAGIERLVDQSRAPQPPPLQVNATPPAPVLPQEPAAIHEPEPAIAHAEVLPQPEAAQEQPVACLSETAPEEEPLFSEAAMGIEVPVNIPVLAHVPEIVSSEKVESARVNGAVSEPPVAESVASEPPLQTEPAPDAEPHKDAEPPHKHEESYEWVNRIGLELLAPRPKPRMGWRVPVLVGLVAGLILIAGLLYSGVFQRYFDRGATTPPSTLASTGPGGETASTAPNAADLPALEQRAASQPNDAAAAVELGREYQRRKDWTKAEAAFRSALETSPGNRDAALGLSDVLYQEQKYEESAAVLNKLSSSKSQ